MLTPDRGATDSPQITGMEKAYGKNVAGRKIHEGSHPPGKKGGGFGRGADWLRD